MIEIMSINAITIGPRFRRDFSGVEALAVSIKAVGLLQPPGVTPDGRLLWGECRLRACRNLGWTAIPVTVRDVEPSDWTAVEAAENFARKDFTLSEAVAIKRALEPKLKAEAEVRRKAGTLVQSLHKGKTREHAAAVTGFSHETLRKAEAVVEAAETEPAKFAKLAVDMDRTGRVEGPYKRLRVARQAEAIRAEPPPLPGKGPYRVIVADPPWPYELRRSDPSHRATHPYPQMSLAEIAALDVPSIASPDAILWLWTTNHHMREAFTVVDAWGFEHKTILTWAKDRIGYGDWLRGQTEHVLFAVRGSPVVTLAAHSTLLRASVGAHSQKPAEFFELVKALCPAPPGGYLELFARQTRPGWDSWGDEVNVAAE